MFIRHCNAKEQANHTQFEMWVEWYYKTDISDEEWKAIIEEDEARNYELNGHGKCSTSAGGCSEHLGNSHHKWTTL